MIAAGPTRQLAEWPELPYDAWMPTMETLHMKLQIIGKVRLALTQREPQWANVPLYLTARGLTTSPIWSGHAGFSIDVESRTLSAAKHGPTAKNVAITPAAIAVIRFMSLTLLSVLVKSGRSCPPAGSCRKACARPRRGPRALHSPVSALATGRKVSVVS